MTPRYALFTAALVSGLYVAAQPLPNGGFEEWANGMPTGWLTNNIVPLNMIAVTESGDEHGGSSAARGEVLPPGAGSKEPYVPVLQQVIEDFSGEPGSLMGWYKFDATATGTEFMVSVTLLDASSNMTGIGVLLVTAEATSYTQFSIPIDYEFGSGAPSATATVLITMGSETDVPGVGSWFLVDDLAFGAGTGLEELDQAGLVVGQPFPQPVNSTLSIPVEMGSTGPLTAEVLDMRGARVALLVDGQVPGGPHTLTWSPDIALANGPYVVRVRSRHSAINRLVTMQR